MAAKKPTKKKSLVKPGSRLDKARKLYKKDPGGFWQAWAKEELASRRAKGRRDPQPFDKADIFDEDDEDVFAEEGYIPMEVIDLQEENLKTKVDAQQKKLKKLTADAKKLAAEVAELKKEKQKLQQECTELRSNVNYLLDYA